VVEGRLTLFVLDIYGALSATQSSVDRIEMGMRDGELKLADRSITLLRFLRYEQKILLSSSVSGVETPNQGTEMIVGKSRALLGLLALLLLLFGLRRRRNGRDDDGRFEKMSDDGSSVSSCMNREEPSSKSNIRFDDHAISFIDAEDPSECKCWDSSCIRNSADFSNKDSESDDFADFVDVRVSNYDSESDDFADFVVRGNSRVEATECSLPHNTPQSDTEYLREFRNRISAKYDSSEDISIADNGCLDAIMESMTGPYGTPESTNKFAQGAEDGPGMGFSLHSMLASFALSKRFSIHGVDDERGHTIESMGRKIASASKCAICYKIIDEGTAKKRCHCGRKNCDKVAHTSCIMGKYPLPSVSHPGTPPPMLPPILCRHKRNENDS